MVHNTMQGLSMSVELLEDITKFLNTPTPIEEIDLSSFKKQPDSMKIIDENFEVYKQNKACMRQVLKEMRIYPEVISEAMLTHTIFTMDALQNIRNELQKIKSSMRDKIDFDLIRFLKVIEYELAGCQILYKKQIVIHAEKSLTSGYSKEKIPGE